MDPTFIRLDEFLKERCLGRVASGHDDTMLRRVGEKLCSELESKSSAGSRDEEGSCCHGVSGRVVGRNGEREGGAEKWEQLL